MPFTEVQERALDTPQFRELLDRLGFDLPQPLYELYPRMHQNWTPQEIVNKARVLGEVNFGKLTCCGLDKMADIFKCIILIDFFIVLVEVL